MPNLYPTKRNYGMFRLARALAEVEMLLFKQGF